MDVPVHLDQRVALFPNTHKDVFYVVHRAQRATQADFDASGLVVSFDMVLCVAKTTDQPKDYQLLANERLVSDDKSKRKVERLFPLQTIFRNRLCSRDDRFYTQGYRHLNRNAQGQTFTDRQTGKLAGVNINYFYPGAGQAGGDELRIHSNEAVLAIRSACKACIARNVALQEEASAMITEEFGEPATARQTHSSTPVLTGPSTVAPAGAPTGAPGHDTSAIVAPS